jgi:general secretion pathway protein D
MCAVCALCALGPSASLAQEERGVTMDFPAEGVELRTLADIVTKRLKIPIIYDETINNKKVIIRVPVDVPESALLGVLQSALRMKQMALVDAEQPPGWKQIVPMANVGAAGAGVKAAGPIEVKFVPVRHADPQGVAQLVQQILSAREGGGAAAAGAAPGGVVVTPDERGGQVIVVAPRERMQEVTELISGLDKPVATATKVYRLKSVAPERVDRLVKNLLGADAATRAYQSTIDRESQTLVVSGSDEVIKRVDTLVAELDKPVDQTQSPVRFYRLKNTAAVDVLATISSLMGEGASVVQPTAGAGLGGERSLLGPPEAPADNRVPLRPQGSEVAPMTPGVNVERSPRSALNAANAPAAPAAQRPRAEDLGPLSEIPTRGAERREEGDEGARRKQATVTADVNTNSIIVIAPPAVQQMYEKLIAELDRRRPQVQIECTVVTLDTSDNFEFGVDVGKEGGFGEGNKIISFGSFGVARVDPATGSLTPIARTGGTFALLSPGIADVVIHALSGNSRARLVSAPQMLVNDNGKGKLQSVSQEPFAEILDTATTQSRTGLGGLAQAGTTISVEPHISEDDYLQLAYSIELSSFTGQGRQGLPPPSQKNSVDSTVTIPDGHTIVVGGLRVKNFRQSMESLPIIDKIPIVNWMIGSRSQTRQDLTLFVFIKPTILRDDRFEDLKYVSGKALKEVGLPGSYPASSPIPVR